MSILSSHCEFGIEDDGKTGGKSCPFIFFQSQFSHSGQLCHEIPFWELSMRLKSFRVFSFRAWH